MSDQWLPAPRHVRSSGVFSWPTVARGGIR